MEEIRAKEGRRGWPRAKEELRAALGAAGHGDARGGAGSARAATGEGGAALEELRSALDTAGHEEPRGGDGRGCAVEGRRRSSDYAGGDRVVGRPRMGIATDTSQICGFGERNPILNVGIGILL